MMRTKAAPLFHFHLCWTSTHTDVRVKELWLYLMPNTRSIRNPPKKQRTTLGQEYQAYSCMNFAVFRSRSWCSREGRHIKFWTETQAVWSLMVAFMSSLVWLFWLDYHANVSLCADASLIRFICKKHMTIRGTMSQPGRNVNCCIYGALPEDGLPGWILSEVQPGCHNRSSFLEEIKHIKTHHIHNDTAFPQRPWTIMWDFF